MSFPKLLLIAALLLFGLIGGLALFKGDKTAKERPKAYVTAPLATPRFVEISLKEEIITDKPAQAPAAKPVAPPLQAPKATHLKNTSKDVSKEPLPEGDRIQELFNRGEPKLPFVETIVYKSHVPWLKGRQAWLSDYASYYGTSRHFIARSLNGSPDYFKQNIAEGDRINVFSKDKNIEFLLVVSTSDCKMWFYCLDKDSNQRWLLKTYRVGLGRKDSEKASGLLTPHGKFTLGSKVGIYKPKMHSIYNGRKTEMVTVFGTRWIPFDQEVSGCSSSGKGFGLHGVPWISNEKGELVEDASGLGNYQSDGCIRLATADIEELFAIMITKPATIELASDFHQVTLPGSEK